jgi:hypothetical protein
MEPKNFMMLLRCLRQVGRSAVSRGNDIVNGIKFAVLSGKAQSGS